MAPENRRNSPSQLNFSQALMTAGPGSETNAAGPAKPVSREALVKKPGSTVSFRDAGYPGYLTDEEFFIFERFRNEVYSRSNLRTTAFSFASAHEDEDYALCRWLRARKYNLSDTIKMVEEATECTAEPRENDFYPCPKTALSVERSLYIKTFPQFYYGYAKNGCPIFINQCGRIDTNTMACLTGTFAIINYHWYAMMHEYNQKLKEQYEASNGAFKRFECVIIIDLTHLSPLKLGKDSMKIIKDQTRIDSLCFPETMNKMIIINAPAYFTLTWKIIKGWIDQRSADKVEVLGTNKTKVTKRLLEIVDADQLPSDYGGTGESVSDFLKRDMIESFEKSESGGSLKLVEENNCFFHLKGKASKSITVTDKRVVKLSLFTRSATGCTVSVTDSNGKELRKVAIKHKGSVVLDGTELPTRYNLEDYGVVLKGPETYTISLVSNGDKPDILMVWHEFIVKQPDVVKKTKPQAPLRPPSSTSSSVRTAESICVGTFSNGIGRTNDFSVKASPYMERKLAASKQMLPRSNDNDDGNIEGVPRVKRVTDTSTTEVNYQVVPPSPKKGTGSFCGIATGCNF